MEKTKGENNERLQSEGEELAPSERLKAKGLGKVKKDLFKPLDRKSKKSPLASKKSVKTDNPKEVEEDMDLNEYKLAGGIKYKLPSRRQRMILSFTLFGLNALLLVAVFLYFKVQGFHDFIINVGR